MNKYYANKEMVFPFKIVNQSEYEKVDIEQRNFLNELFESLLLEIDGRMVGASLLSEMAIGDELDSNCVEDEDWSIYTTILCEKDLDKLVVDEDVLLIAKKRLDAFKTFHDAIKNAYDETIANSNGGDSDGN